MRAALTAAGLAVALGDLWLVVICWLRRSVLAGLLGAAGIPVVLFAIVDGPTRDSHAAVLLIAGIMLVVADGAVWPRPLAAAAPRPRA